MLLVYLIVFLISVWFLANRLLPWLLARIVSLFLSQAKFRLGAIGRRLELFQSQLQFRNIEVCVDNLRLTSSVFSSEASNLITIIMTGVSVTVTRPGPSDNTVTEERREKPRNTKTFLLLAQFLGVQIRDLSLRVNHLPSMADCHLEVKLGELRLDSSVIHRTKLSLALYLYDGNLVVKHSTHGSLLESTFAFQASIQASVAGGKVTSVEDVNLDVDGLSLQLYSSLFQCVLPVEKRTGPQPHRDQNSFSKFSAFIPKAAQIKAEHCGAVLEHSDRSSQLTGSLSLLYVCVKCSDPQLASGASLPDSHLTGQVSGLRVWANNNTEDTVLSLAKFQVLVQKEAASLHSDTQVHELTGAASGLLLPWMEPVSWLLRTVEARRQTQTPAVDQRRPWMSELTHQHRVDAWNSDFSLNMDDRVKWRLSLHQVNILYKMIIRKTCFQSS